jgi:hypothetical protein
MYLKYLLLLILAKATLMGSPIGICPPATVGNGPNVSITCPGLGVGVVASSNATAQTQVEDNPAGQGDYNFTDFLFSTVFNSSATQALVTFEGSWSSYFDTLLYNGAPLFNNATGGSALIATVPGSLLDFQIHATFTAFPLDEIVNIAGVSSDGGIHGYTIESIPVSNTPEPASITMVLIGLGLAWIGVRSRNIYA